jgi:type IV secretion system protein VirB10
MPIGTMIPAVLETPIDSARPGLVRAIVSEDTRGFDGKRVLVPRGSRLIGEYQSDVRSGQSRVLVTWNRLLRPDGVAIRIGSPAADALGGAGVPGHVNSFFFQRFASAVLQSALTVGVNLASRPASGSVIVGLPTNTVGMIGQDLIPGSDLKPKIKVKQGAVLQVFVAHDLDFSGTVAWPNGETQNGR